MLPANSFLRWWKMHGEVTSSSLREIHQAAAASQILNFGPRTKERARGRGDLLLHFLVILLIWLRIFELDKLYDTCGPAFPTIGTWITSSISTIGKDGMK
jgi:hypothetical protein